MDPDQKKTHIQQDMDVWKANKSTITNTDETKRIWNRIRILYMFNSYIQDVSSSEDRLDALNVHVPICAD